MQPGTKPKPTVLKLLRGVENKDRINQNEPKPEKKLLKCPYYIKQDKIAKQEWDKIIPELYILDLLTSVDRVPIEIYCTQYSIYRKPMDNIKEHGLTVKATRGGKKPNPSLAIARESAKIIKAIAVEFGLTSSSRVRISVPDQPNEEEEWQNMLNGK